MEWFILALLRALFISGKETSLKLSLSRLNASVTICALYMTGISVVVLMPFVLLDGSWRCILYQPFWQAVLGNIILNIFGHLLLLTSIKRFDISYVSAILATSPLIFGGFSAVFLGQNPGIYAFAFMGLIAIGGVFVELSRKQIKGFKNFILHSGWLPLLAYLCVAAGATVFSKLAVTHGDAEAYIAFRYAGLSLIFFVIHYIHEKHIKKQVRAALIRLDGRAALAGVFMMCAVICEMNALRFTDIARVEAVTKFSIISTLLIDAFIISKNLRWERWVGVFLILSGGIGTLLY